jgi:hypothetical protein
MRHCYFYIFFLSSTNTQRIQLSVLVQMQCTFEKNTWFKTWTSKELKLAIQSCKHSLFQFTQSAKSKQQSDSIHRVPTVMDWYVFLFPINRINPTLWIYWFSKLLPQQHLHSSGGMQLELSIDAACKNAERDAALIHLNNVTDDAETQKQQTAP